MNEQSQNRKAVDSLKNFSVEGRLPTTSPPSIDSVEMLTIKEYARRISGLPEYTIQQLVLQNKLLNIRVG